MVGISNHKQFVLLLAVAILSARSDVVLADGKLQRLRSEVRDEDSSEKKKKEKSSSTFSCDDDDEDFLDELMKPLVLYTVAASFVVPHLMLEGDIWTTGYFQDYPYESFPGHMVIDSSEFEGTSSWFGRFTAQYGDDLDGVSLIGGRLLLDSHARLGLDVEWNRHGEILSDGDTDHLWTGDVNAVFRFAQSEHVEFRSGCGLNWLSDEIGSDYGFNFTYGADIYPVRPWVVSTSLDLGKLGEATRLHLRGTGGVIHEGL